MSETVLVAVIGALQAVTLGVLGYLGNAIVRTRAHAASAAVDARVARDQVANDHTTNLREESDERHAENAKTGSEILRLIRSNARTAAARDRRIEKRLTILEDKMT